jgi:hypothetical protein
MIDWDKLMLTSIGDEAFKATVEAKGMKGVVRIAETSWTGVRISLLPEEFWQEVLAECVRRAVAILKQPNLTRSDRQFITELLNGGFVQAKHRPKRKFHPFEGAARWVRSRAAELRKGGMTRGAQAKAIEELTAYWNSSGRELDGNALVNYMSRSSSKK